MKNWLTRYRPRYIRSLVYMLQASEYNIRDYLDWYGRTKDWSGVERRKQLIKTPKAVLILILAWAIFFIILGIAFSLLWLESNPLKYILFIGIILLEPYFLAYGIIAPVVLIRIFPQWPIEQLIIWNAMRKLKKHGAVKIAIAGSFGKTSMREILKTVLSENKKVAASPENYNTPLGISRFINDLKGDEEILIFELGEYYPGDINKLCRLTQPQLGIVTGVNESHLKKFKSLDKTVKTIFELSDWLKNGPTYINGESDLARRNASDKHIIYSREGVGAWKVGSPHTDLTGTTFTLSRNGQHLKLKTKLLGLHQIGPLTAAADIAMRLKLSADQIEQGIAKTKPFDHRLEPKTDDHGVTILDDSYNGNPDGVKAVIEFLGSLKSSRRFYVTPGLVEMGYKTEVVHREIGAQLARAGIEKVILIRNSVTHFVSDGLKNANYKGDIMWFDDALAMFEALPHLTVKGDIVLLQNDWPDQYS